MMDRKVFAKDSQERLTMVEAIYALRRKVTVGDVVRQTGLPSVTVATGLRDLAFESGAHILVDLSGNIAYSFSRGFERKPDLSLTKILSLMWGGFVFVYRLCMKMAFGMAMLFSLITFALPLLFISTIKSIYDFVNMKGYFANEATGNNMNTWDLDIVPRVLALSARTEVSRNGQIVPSNIFLDCYSFVFGDGNPNLDLDDRKWLKITQLIERNQGVVTCEQVAPFIGRRAREDDMIPVMVRFNGMPEVTQSGEIIYSFPEMAVRASKTSTTPAEPDDNPDYLDEKYWQFSGISDFSKSLIVSLVMLNGLTLVLLCMALVGLKGSLAAISLWFIQMHLWWLLHFLIAAFHLVGIWGILAGVVFGLVALLALFLLATFFVFYPAARYCLIQFKNLVIILRNAQRRKLALALLQPTPQLQMKLAESRRHSLAQTKVDENQIAFDSWKDSLEQQF